MATITDKRNDVFGECSYVAAPTSPTLTEIIDNSRLKDKFFPLMGAPKFIDARKAVLCEDGSFTDFTLTYSNIPQISPNFYDLKKSFGPKNTDLPGYTTLHVSALGTSKEKTHNIVKEVLGFFPNVVELEILPQIKEKLVQAFQGLLKEFETHKLFFDKYNSILARLSQTKKVSHKKIEKGIFISLMDTYLSTLGVRGFPEKYDVRLLNRKEGQYEGMPLELSLIYVSGPRINPGAYGVFLSRKHIQGCPSWEENLCDQSRSYAGYMFRPDNLVFGGSRLLPKSSEVYGADMPGMGGRRDYCIKAVVNKSANTPMDSIAAEIDNLRKHKIPQEQIDEIKKITQLVHQSHY